MKPPSITVIIPTRNRLGSLAETLSSLGHQDIPVGAFEVVVVDDGSSPPVPMDMGASRPRIVRLEGKERSAARNAGVSVARGEILVFLDDDVTVGSDFLSAHLAAQREWPGVLAVGRLELADQEAEMPFVRFRRSLEGGEVPSHRGLVQQRNFCTAANMSIPRDTFVALGGFAEDIVSSEDQDLALRHTRAGGRIVFIPEARGLHRDRALDISSYCRRVEWGSEYMVLFCRRHPLWPDNVERERVNGQLRLGRGLLRQISGRLLKKVLGQRTSLAVLFGATRLLERRAPESVVLLRLYRALIGIHIFRGYRRGTRRFGPPPLPRLD